MKKKTTVNVVGGDDTAEISKAIIKTHEHCIMNLNILNDRERGYMFNEYFPAVKRHLEDPLDVLISSPCAEDMKTFTGDRKILTDIFKQTRDDGQPHHVSLSNIPHAILNVRVARSTEAERMGHFWCLEPVKLWTVNTNTGTIDFMEDVNTIAIMQYLNVDSDYYIFVDYVSDTESKCEAGTDGEN